MSDFKKQIRISKIDNAGPNAEKKWNKYEIDGVTPHVCSTISNNATSNNNSTDNATTLKERQDRDGTTFQEQKLIHRSEELDEIRKEVGILNTLLRTLVNQVQLMRQELSKK